MSYQALYRKYRSQTFGDLVGQDHVITALKNAIERDKIAHAYLFTGPRGTGKTSTARLLAKALNCTNGPSSSPPDDDPICQDIADGNCMDVMELDAASEAGVEKVRENIVDFVDYKPAYCRYRIFIIDEVHDLSPKAFDALLKTIEEPPPHIIFILATTEFSKVPTTIRSRCQKFEFHRGTIQELMKRLEYVCKQEKIQYDVAALNILARAADGAYRDALTLLEQVLLNAEGIVTPAHVYEQLGMVGDEIVDRLIEAIIKSDVASIIAETEETYRLGRDPRSVVESITLRLADLTRACYDIAGQEVASDAAGAAVAARFGQDNILHLRAELAGTHHAIKDVTLPRQWLESELIRLGFSLNTPRHAPVSPKADAPRVERPTQVLPRAAAPAKIEPTPSAPKLQAQVTPAFVGDHKNGDNFTWAWIVETISKMSPSAKKRLANSRLLAADPDLVKVELELSMSVEMVSENKKLQSELNKLWKEATGHSPAFEFSASSKAVTSVPTVETRTVESEFEGERLRDVIHEVFGTTPTEN